MRSGRSRLCARALAVAAAGLVVAATPGVAQGATEYDGEATALRIEGLRLELLPGGLDSLPKAFDPLVTELEKLQAQAPEELQRDSLTIAVPDQVVGSVTYPDTDTQGEIPPNPLIAAEAIEAKAVKLDNGNVLTESSLAGLSLAEGVLSADVIKTGCVGDGESIRLDVSQLRLNSTEQIVDSEVRLEPGTAVPIDALGTITFNQQDTDGKTFGEATNVEIALDTDLSLASLESIFDKSAPALERAVKQVLRDLAATKVNRQGAPPEVAEGINQLQGAQLYGELNSVVGEVTGPAKKNLPPEARNALNNIAHLGGTITIANSACSQAQVPGDSSVVSPDNPAPVAQPVADQEPPLADTGSPAGIAGVGIVGILLLAAGAYAMTRLRRRGENA